MSKFLYIISILSLVAYSFADEAGCMELSACNYDEFATVGGECVDQPGVVDLLTSEVNSGEDVAVINWSQPCGLGNIFAYSLVGIIDGESVNVSISSPLILEGLSWSTTYNLEIHTLSEYGESITPFQVSIGPETIPGQIHGLVAEAGEASISLYWDIEEYSSNYRVYIDADIVETTSDNTNSIIITDLDANINYGFQVSGLNSEGVEGEISELVDIQVLPIFPVEGIELSSGAGQIIFTWLSPDPYDGDDNYVFIISDESDTVIEQDYIGNSYIIDDLNENEERCIKIAAVHQFGESLPSEDVCGFPLLSEVDILPPTSGEGFVSLDWNEHPDADYYNIYRDDILIRELVWSGNACELDICSYDDMNLQVNTEYSYEIVALYDLSLIDDDLGPEGNIAYTEGAFHEPVFITITPLPIINNLVVLPGSGRAIISWIAPADYGGFGYQYAIYNSFGFIDSTELNQTFISGLEQTESCCNLNPIPDDCNCNEYCYVIKSISLGGYGSSEPSEESCAIPYTPYGDGSGSDSLNLQWGIQIIAKLEPFSESISNQIDEFNLIGVSELATDAYDSNLDFPDSPNPNSQFSLFFPHIEWGNPFNDNFSQDIRSNLGLPDTVIVWDALLATEIPGNPYLTFYFNNINDLITVYASYYDSSNDQEKRFQKIENGDTINLETIFSGSGNGSNLEIIVGQAIPDAPINIGGFGGYRETTITWDDSCCQPGLQQYPAELYNIWRGGQLVGKDIIGNTFTDRGWNCFNGANSPYMDGEYDSYECTTPLNTLTNYTYRVSAVNIAGESERSFGEYLSMTSENRPPVSKGGMDIIVYDLHDDAEDTISIVLPLYSDFSTENQSYDPDNSYEEDGVFKNYENAQGEIVILDELEFKWSSESDFEYIGSKLSISIEGYGEKGFQLEVNDGTELFSIDSVFVSYLASPAPAIVDSINISAGLYDIKLDWLESMFTGESYADLNNNLVWNDREPFEDCGFDNLCPADIYYSSPDVGESSGTWEFEDCGNDALCPTDSEYLYPDDDGTEGNGWLDFDDLNGNGIWELGEGERFERWNDSNSDGFWNDFEPFVDMPNEDGFLNGSYDDGPRPRPPFYGLPNNIGLDNIATNYKILRNNSSYLEFSATDTLFLNPSLDGDLFTTFTLFDENLEPSTQYCYEILACNFNDSCTYSEEICEWTKDRPTVSVLSPVGAEIFGNDSFDIELEFEHEDLIKSLELQISYDGEFNQGPQTTLLPTEGISVYYENIDLSTFPGYSNEVKIRAIITDTGDYSINSSGGDDFVNYIDVSDKFIISDNQREYYFASGWHLFGTPIDLENSDLYSALNGSGIGFNWTVIDQNGQTSDLSLNSGEGYYLWLYEAGSMLLSGELYSQFDVQLDEGWNLISNPLIETINMGAFDILRNSGEELTMSEALSLSLVSSRMIGFDNLIATHVPSLEIEPFMGYWIFAYEPGLVLKIGSKSNPEIISEPDGASDWRLTLSARADGSGEEWYNPFGDVLSMGFSQNASNELIPGEDDYHLPLNPSFSSYVNFKIEDTTWVDGSNEDFRYFSKDIKKAHDRLYEWKLVGESLNITNSLYNEYGEIIISWEMDELNEDYSIKLYIGDNPIDMRDQPGNQVTVMSDEFENIRIEVEMLEYTSGCGDENACNYYCLLNIDCDVDNNPPQPFFDNGSCESESCSGCSDEDASNYNPHYSEIDTVNCEYLQSFLLPYDKNIYPETNIVNRIPVKLYNYDFEIIAGIGIQLVVDSDKVMISDIVTKGIFESYSLIFGYTDTLDFNIDAESADTTWITNDTLGITLFSSNPISSSSSNGIDEMFDLILEVRGDIGEQVTINFVQSDLNISSQLNTNFQKLNIVQGLFQVASSVGYYSNEDAPVHDAVLDLVGISEFTGLDTLYNELFDSAGELLFPAVLRGDYLSVIGKEDNSTDGLSAVDASRIARNSVQLFTFTPQEKYAADVDLNGWINAADASAVAQFLVGSQAVLDEDHGMSWRFIPEGQNIITLFDQSFISRIFYGNHQSISDFEYPLDWIFDPSLINMDVLQGTEEIINLLQDESSDNENYVNEILKTQSLSPIIEDSIDQGIVGYKIGDVDGDWWNDINSLTRESVINSYNISISEDESFLYLPLTIEGKNLVEGIDLEFSFDSEIFNLNEFEIISSTLTQDNYQTILSQNEDGVSLVIYCTSDVKNHDGILANLKFQILNPINVDTHININKFMVNGTSSESAGFRINDGSSYIVAQTITFSSGEIPDEYSLSQNFPNPFNPSTNIPFALPFESDVKVNIYDVRGRLVQELVNSYFGSGYHHIPWDASHLSSGLYFIRFESSSLENSKTFSTIQKSLLIK